MKSYTVIFLLALLLGTASAGFYQTTTERMLAKQEKGKMGKKPKKEKKKMGKKKKGETEPPTLAPSPEPTDEESPLDALCYVPRGGLTLKDSLRLFGVPEEQLEEMTDDEAREMIIGWSSISTVIEPEYLNGLPDDELALLFGINVFQTALYYLGVLPFPEERPGLDDLIETQYSILILMGYPEEQVKYFEPTEGLFWMFYIGVGTLCVASFVP